MSSRQIHGYGPSNNQPIAIVGIGCRFPGNANSPSEFWNNLVQGVDSVGEVPDTRWEVSSFFDPDPLAKGKTYSKWLGFVKGIDMFDAEFFGISPREAASMDPQQRMLLEVAYEAIEDGGQTLEQLSAGRTSVFVGISSSDFANLQASPADPQSIDTYTNTGGALSLAANRISYSFNLKGTSLAIDTACSSSLNAIHLACESIWRGESSAALAGGVNAVISPSGFIGFSRLSMLSPDGRCKAFDADGNGYVRGEGAGVILLKPLSAAQADGDHIYATILASAVNQDGRTSSIVVPSEDAQAEMIQAACQRGGVEPAQVQYVEAHGTGTVVGDRIEAMALGRALGGDREAGNECVMGSVKTNIGHLEPAAGVAGLIKTALAMKHGQIPASLHFNNPNPHIDFDGLHLRVATELEPWPAAAGKQRIAGINSFGFGGANAHVILGQAPERPVLADHSGNGKPQEPQQVGDESEGDEAPDESGNWQLFPFSAKSDIALNAVAESFIEFLSDESNPDFSLSEFGYLLSQRRTHHDKRMTIVADTKKKLIEELENSISRQFRSTKSKVGKEKNKLAFVFSGQGPQWWAMGRELIATEPVFRDMIERCDQAMQPYSKWSLIDELLADEDKSKMHLTSIAQPSIFAIQVGLAKLLESWGIVPDAVVGHSVGEIGAAYISGILDLDTACHVIVDRGRCMDKASTRGGMLAVGMTPQQATQLIADHRDQICVAAVNGPTSVTLSGNRTILEQIDQSLGDDVFHRMLRVEYAFHSQQMDIVRDDLLAALEGIQANPAPHKMVSTVTGQWVEGPELGADYWWHNVRNGVQFADGIARLSEAGCGTFVEISAHPALTAFVRECLQQSDNGGQVVSTLRRQEDERREMLTCLGSLFGLGHPVSWSTQFPACENSLKLPAYPWQHQQHWHESDTLRSMRLGMRDHPLLGRRLACAEPVWQIEINNQALPFLWDHVVQGHVVFPAAGYLEIGIAVAREVFGLESCVLEDVDLHRAMFIPETSVERVVLQTVFDAETSEYRVYGKSKADDETWTLLVSGKIRSESPKQIEPRHKALSDTRKEISKADFYDFCVEKSLSYGAAFQGVAKCWRTEAGARGEIVAPSPIEDSVERYRIHPAILDAGLQITFQAATEEGFARPKVSVPLPVHLDRLVYRNPVGASCVCDVVRISEGLKTFVANLQFLDESGKPGVEIEGLYVQSIDNVSDSAGEGVENLTYETQWLLKPLESSSREIESVEFLPAQTELGAKLNALRGDLSGYRWLARGLEIDPLVNIAVSGYIIRAFRELGWKPGLGDTFYTDTFLSDLGIAAHHHQVSKLFLEFLAQDGLLKLEDGQWTVCRVPAQAEPQTAWSQALASFPSYSAELALLSRCGERLAEILRGDVDSVEVIFPAGALDTAEHLYQDSPSLKFCNQVTGQAVALAVGEIPEGRVARILEIGGGTGATTSYVLPQLPAGQYEYVFTDVSPVFFSRAKQKFQNRPAFSCKPLDIEKDPESQGFAPHSFDIIIATDVLHATADLRETLSHVQKLLAPGGLFIFNELNCPLRWIDLVFGLIHGWWRFTDTDLRPNHPTLAQPQWLKLLEECDFVEPLAISDLETEYSPGHVVYLSRGGVFIQDQSPRIEQEAGLDAGVDSFAAATTTPVDQLESESTRRLEGHWLLFADQNGTASRISSFLIADGATTTIVEAADGFDDSQAGKILVNPADVDHFEQMFQALKERETGDLAGIVYCWALDCPSIVETTVESLQRGEEISCHGLMYLVQSWARHTPDHALQLWLITNAAQPAGKNVTSYNISQSPLIGFSRAVAIEHPLLGCKAVDLGLDITDDDIQALREEMQRADQAEEQEVALRGNARYVPRVVRKSTSSFTASEMKRVDPSKTAFRLESGAPGMLERLALREVQSQKEPTGDEVQIRVLAAGLNFRDVMKALGIYPTEADEDIWLGDECVGEITAIGDNVAGWKIGDQVLAVTPSCFSSFVTVSSSQLIPKPDKVDTREAATLPIAFLTAYYALHTLGQMARGERVLIHAATGGVGLAAIQLAKLAGAEIFATAGTEEKRAFLRSLGVQHVMDSRTLDFADEVRRITNGQGVDIVLNSLAGQAISQGLACLSSHGRFLEIGKRDIYQNSKLALRVFKDNISFFAIDLGKVIQQRPQLIRSIWSELTPLFEQQKLHALPCRVYPISDVVGAFRYMGQARHIGKLVLSIQDTNVDVEPYVEPKLQLDANASYLITGGMGGFGLAIAKWLAGLGARHLVLTGRSGASSEKAKATIAELQEQGCNVVVVQADVTLAADVDNLFQQIRDSLPPLRGIMHAAMVIDDAMLLNSTAEQFRKVMAPKMDGAWHLQQATASDPLDFFVLFSSMVQLFGNLGQSNYCAANAFLVMFAHQRRITGLKALAVDWGRLSDVGYVAERSDLIEHFERMGERGISTNQATHILERLLLRDAAHVSAMNLYWPHFSKALLSRATAKFSRLLSLESDSADGSSTGKIRDLLLATDVEKRPALLSGYLAEELANVLGASAEDMDPTTSLSNLGLDSLMTVELKNRIERETGANLPIMEIMRGPSLDELSQLVLKQFDGPTADVQKPGPDEKIEPSVAEESIVATPEAQSAEELLARIDELSEEEIDAVMSQIQDE